MSLWSDPAASPSPFASTRQSPAHVEAVERLKDWTRERFGLGEADTIVVSEISRVLPGWPATETTVAFWPPCGMRHHYRVFKRVEEVTPDDLPPAWLKASLAGNDDIQCACCA